MCIYKRHYHCDGSHMDERCWDCGSGGEPVLPAPRFFTHGGKQYGSGVDEHITRALAGRSAHLGLSLVWLCSLGSFRGAAKYHHRAASHWPSLKGAVIRSRGTPFHCTPTCTAHLWIRPACSPWCCA